jgi:hypothetical protein
LGGYGILIIIILSVVWWFWGWTGVIASIVAAVAIPVLWSVIGDDIKKANAYKRRQEAERQKRLPEVVQSMTRKEKQIENERNRLETLREKIKRFPYINGEKLSAFGDDGEWLPLAEEDRQEREEVEGLIGGIQSALSNLLSLGKEFEALKSERRRLDPTFR